MYIDWHTIITVGGVITALGTILGLVLKIQKWVIKQNDQSGQIEDIKHQHKEDYSRVMTENKLICEALSACLDGLQQLGANHSVPIAKEKLDNYLNEQAHG